jgi:DNA-binding transcriptional regulator GbsR (MarR family)
MSGRLFGWLLISEPPYQSPAELATVLAASKGSISTSIRLLTQMGLIERHIVPGARHGHFRLQEDAILKIIRHGLEQEIEMFRKLAKRGLELMKDIPDERKERLVEMQSRYAYLNKVFPELLENYERNHLKKRAINLSSG